MTGDPEETQAQPTVPQVPIGIIDQKPVPPTAPEAPAACVAEILNVQASVPDKTSLQKTFEHWKNGLKDFAGRHERKSQAIILPSALICMVVGIVVGLLGDKLFGLNPASRLNAILLAFIFLSAFIGISERVNQKIWAIIQFFAGLVLWALALHFST